MVKVLIVEDEEPIRISLTDMLELAGHQVIIADDGELGLQLAQEHLPDLIISDIMMPKMDGHKMLEAIKSELTTAHIPFIFLTALSSYDDLRTGMNLGADDYLAKPFNYKQLTSAVNARLNKHAQEEQLRLRRFAQRLVDIQERERSQLAYDLEESIQEPLNSLKMLLTLAQQTQDVVIGCVTD
ncbi:MAG: response regulator [Chloroflexota bacterium]